jgi:hypothetical protein
MQQGLCMVELPLQPIHHAIADLIAIAHGNHGSSLSSDPPHFRQ